MCRNAQIAKQNQDAINKSTYLKYIALNVQLILSMNFLLERNTHCVRPNERNLRPCGNYVFNSFTEKMYNALQSLKRQPKFFNALHFCSSVAPNVCARLPNAVLDARRVLSCCKRHENELVFLRPLTAPSVSAIVTRVVLYSKNASKFSHSSGNCKFSHILIVAKNSRSIKKQTNGVRSIFLRIFIVLKLNALKGR